MLWCRFFSSLIQRAAKLAKRKGGGSMSLLMVGAGMPARGEAPLPPPTAEYKHLSEQQRQKLKAALEAAQQDVRLSQPEGCLRVEVTSSVPLRTPMPPVLVRRDTLKNLFRHCSSKLSLFADLSLCVQLRLCISLNIRSL